MAFRLSTALRNALLEKEASVNAMDIFVNALTFVDGGGGNDSITAASGLDIFRPGDKLTINGSVSNDVTVEILTVSATTIEVPTGTLTAEDATGITVAMAACRGGSFNDLFRNGVMRIFTGSQPGTADAAETGTLLVEITVGSGTFVSGQPANGLNFGETAIAGVLGKSATETWSGQAGNTGTAGWFRFYPNDVDNHVGADSGEAMIRFDGAIATSGAQLNMSNTSITSGGTTTIDTVAVTIPTA